MRTIRAIFQSGTLKPLDPVELPENTRVTVALLEGDDLSPEAIAELADCGKAFEFLNDPREDLYSDSDGESASRSRWPWAHCDICCESSVRFI